MVYKFNMKANMFSRAAEKERQREQFSPGPQGPGGLIN